MNSQQPGQSNESFKIGTVVVDTYKILDFIGQGGMGQVFKVEHLTLAKVLAMKILRQGQVSPEVWQRFRTEAQAIARVDHANIIKIFDMSQTKDGLPFYTMDFLQGESLADRLEEAGRLSIEEALPIFEQICTGLGFAHDRGIIHRDIKPGNIMILYGSEQVKIVDFGIAKLLSYDTNVHQGLTKPGEVFGSPLYMSPEQSLGQKVDYRTDMYSVGVTLFQALTGKPPLLGKSAVETIVLHQTVPAPSMSEMAVNTGFPQALEKIVAELMSKDPEQRPSSLYEVAEQLKALRAGRAIRSSKSETLKISLPTSADDETLVEDDKNKQILIVSIPLLVILIATIAYVAYYLDQKHQAELAVKNSPALKTMFTDNGKSREKPKEDVHDFTPTKFAPITDSIFEKSQALKITGVMTKEESSLIKQYLAKNKKPYSHAVKINGKDFLQFDFPEKFSIGVVSYQIAGQNMESVLAQGKVLVPKGVQMRFDVEENSGTYPELLKFFRTNDIHALAVRYLPKNHPYVGAYVCKIKGLSQLDFRKNKEIQDADLKWIDNVPQYDYLNLAENPITASALVPLKMWSRVTGVNINYKMHVTALLKVLVAKQRLTRLSAARCGLGEDDYELISKLKQLNLLCIRNNNLTDGQLAKLLKLNLLADLSLQRCHGLSPKSIATLARFKNLKVLTVDEEVFEPKVLQGLKKARPDLNIVVSD